MGKNTSDKSGIKWRSVVSLSTTWLFLVMGITGLILYVVPQGRIAYWVDWRLLGLSKTDWGNVHIVTSILFVASGAFHIYYNWRAFLGHLRKKVLKGIGLRKELFVTVAAAVFVTASALWNIPPLGYLIDLNETIKDSWIEDKSYEPPFGHAELLSLDGFCRKTGLDIVRAQSALKERGIVVESSGESLASIARNNEISPKDVFSVIKNLRKRAENKRHTTKKLTDDDVFEQYEGTGVGKLKVLEACEDAGQASSTCMGRLRMRGLAADEEDTIKEIAGRHNLLPIQVLQNMLVER